MVDRIDPCCIDPCDHRLRIEHIATRVLRHQELELVVARRGQLASLECGDVDQIFGLDLKVPEVRNNGSDYF